jgi:hypothetical protein
MHDKVETFERLSTAPTQDVESFFANGCPPIWLGRADGSPLLIAIYHG